MLPAARPADVHFPGGSGVHDHLRELRQRNAVFLYHLPDPHGGVIGPDDDPDARDRWLLRALDDLVETTRQLFDVAYAGVHVITPDTQTTMAATDDSVPARIPREDSLCAAVLDGHGEASIIEIPDATQETTLADNPFVDGEFGQVRFYAAALLRGREDITLGTLCIASHEPRVLTEAERRHLLYLGYAAVHLLDLHRRRRHGSSAPDAVNNVAPRNGPPDAAVSPEAPDVVLPTH